MHVLTPKECTLSRVLAPRRALYHTFWLPRGHYSVCFSTTGPWGGGRMHGPCIHHGPLCLDWWNSLLLSAMTPEIYLSTTLKVVGEHYLDRNKLSVIGLQRPWWHHRVVREVRVVGASAEEVEEDGDVEGKHRYRQVPVVQQGRQTAVQKDTGESGGADYFLGKKALYTHHNICILESTPSISMGRCGEWRAAGIFSSAFSLETCAKGLNICNLYWSDSTVPYNRSHSCGRKICKKHKIKIKSGGKI